MSLFVIAFFAGFLLSVPLSILLIKIVQIAWRLKRVSFFSISPVTGAIEHTWQKAGGQHPTIKVFGNKVDGSLLERDFLYSYKDRPAFFVSKANGEPFKVHPDKPLDYPWPDAYDRLKSNMDIREKNVAKSSQGDLVEWAKYGAIIGGIAVLLLFVILFLLWQRLGF